MPDRLPGGGHEIDIVGREFVVLQQPLHSRREYFAQEEIELADRVDARFAGIEQPEDFRPKLGWKWIAAEGEQLHLRVLAVTGNLDERGIDAVDRRAGHQPDDKPRLLDRDVQKSPDAIHASSTSRSGRASSSRRASSGEMRFFAITAA